MYMLWTKASRKVGKIISDTCFRPSALEALQAGYCFTCIRRSF